LILKPQISQVLYFKESVENDKEQVTKEIKVAGRIGDTKDKEASDQSKNPKLEFG
jgi:hypothetical protein